MTQLHRIIPVLRVSPLGISLFIVSDVSATALPATVAATAAAVLVLLLIPVVDVIIGSGNASNIDRRKACSVLDGPNRAVSDIILSLFFKTFQSEVGATCAAAAATADEEEEYVV